MTTARSPLTYVSSKWQYLKTHKTFQKSPLQSFFRIGLWGVHCLAGVPATIRLSRWNCLLFLPPKFRKAGSTGIFVTREDYEPELLYLEKVLSPGKVFIDGGANLGIYTVAAAKLVGDSGRVLSFEPGQETFATLEHNIKINQFKQANAFPLALSDQVGTARLYHIADASNSFSLGKSGDPDVGYEEISTTTIQHVVEQEGLDRVDMIKLDVEGAEELVLRGSRALIEKMRPVILFEVSVGGTRRLGLSEHGVFDLLRELHYKFFTVDKNSGQLVALDSPKLGNTIAIPEV
ncbi:MAG: FkbM family methyltransferase [Microcoleaceae cyanobacterium]